MLVSALASCLGSMGNNKKTQRPHYLCYCLSPKVLRQSYFPFSLLQGACAYLLCFSLKGGPGSYRVLSPWQNQKFPPTDTYIENEFVF